jgi:hypothetical protein
MDAAPHRAHRILAARPINRKNTSAKAKNAPTTPIDNNSAETTDVLGSIEGGLGYDELLPSTIEIQIRNHIVKVLSLKAMIENRKKLTRAKDRYTLATLEETYAAISKKNE